MYRHSVYTVLIAGIVLLIRFGEWRGIDLSSDGWCWNQAVNILLCCRGSFIQYVIIWILSTIIFCWQFSQLLLLLVVDQISNGWNNVWRGFNHERVTTKGLGLCFQGVYTCVNSLMLCKGMLLFHWCFLNKFTIITMLFLEMNSVTVCVEYVIYQNNKHAKYSVTMSYTWAGLHANCAGKSQQCNWNLLISLLCSLRQSLVKRYYRFKSG